MNESEFSKREFEERLFLKKIIPISFPGEISHYFTDINSRDIYDACVMLYHPETKSLTKRYIIEIKVRQVHYHDLMLEKKKLEALKKKASECDADIIYISVTPNGCFSWNIKELEETMTFEYKSEMHWKTSMNKSAGKVLKKVTYLSTELANRLDITTNLLPKLIQEDLESKKVGEVKPIEVKLKTRCIFEGMDKK